MKVARFRYGALLGITVTMTVFALAARDGRATWALEIAAAGTALVVAVITSGAPRAERRAAGVAVAGAVVAAAVVAAAANPSAKLPLAMTAVLLALTVAVVAGGLIRLILQRGVNVTAVFGALAVYLLLGLAFAFTIGAFATGRHGDYFAQGTDGSQSDRVYFSFTALTTTGFGDLTARTRAGHALVVLEMLTGQLYLVTVISLLVGNLRRREPA
jgi:hypothetical protein